MDQPNGPEGRESKGQRTRRAILDTARALFLEQGYHATTMRQVAARSELTVAALYNHVQGKNELWEQVFREANPFSRVPQALEGARGDDAEALLQDAARRLYDAVKANPDHLRLVLIELLEFQGQHLARVLAENAPVVIAFEKRCESLGARLRPLPPFLLSRTFLGLLSAWFLADTLFHGHMPPSLAALRIEDAVGVFLHGALQPTPSTATERP